MLKYRRREKSLSDKKELSCSVEFYAGYKGEETPRSVSIKGKTYDVEKILWRKRSEESVAREFRESFGCVIDGREAVLTIAPSGEGRILFREKPEKEPAG